VPDLRHPMAELEAPAPAAAPVHVAQAPVHVAKAAPVHLAPEPVIRQQEPEPSWGWTEPWSFEVPAAGPSSGRGTPRNASRRNARRTARRSKWLHAIVAFSLVAFAASVWIVAPWSPSANARSAPAHARFTPHPSAFALQTIPSVYLHDYWKVAEEYGLNWAKLAAVGQIESNQGRNPAPGVSQGTTPDGAAGPAQFLGSTWARYGVDADGRGGINPYDPADAITAMAAYLKASGAPQHWRAALYAYNHSIAYVNAIIALSRLYLSPHPKRG
jgi:hypothetical protein